MSAQIRRSVDRLVPRGYAPVAFRHPQLQGTPPLFALRPPSLRLLASFTLALLIAAGQAVGGMRAECCQGVEHCRANAANRSECCVRGNQQPKHADRGSIQVRRDCCCVLSDVRVGLLPSVNGERAERDGMHPASCDAPHAGVSATPQKLATNVVLRQPPAVSLCVTLCRWQI